MTPVESSWWSPWREAEGSLILHVDLRPDEDREARAVELLDEEERPRWNRFLVKRAKRQFSLCRAALRINLCERLGCSNQDLSFGYLEHGKPFARVKGRRPPVNFNVSHSGEHGLIAFGEHDQLGVDVEVRVSRDDFDGIGKRVYGQAERRALESAEGKAKLRLFYRLWSLKEALIKALGTGFSLSPSRFEVPPAILSGERAAEFRFPHAPADAFWLEDLGEPRFAAASAYRLPARDALPSGKFSAD